MLIILSISNKCIYFSKDALSSSEFTISILILFKTFSTNLLITMRTDLLSKNSLTSFFSIIEQMETIKITTLKEYSKNVFLMNNLGKISKISLTYLILLAIKPSNSVNSSENFIIVINTSIFLKKMWYTFRTSKDTILWKR